MNIRSFPPAWTVALLLAAIMIGLEPGVAHAGTTSSNLNDVFADVSGQNSAFNWGIFLNWVIIIVVPIVGILIVLGLIQRIQQDPSPGNLAINGLAALFVMGICLAIVVLPSKIQAKAAAANPSGALLTIYVSGR